MGEDYKIYWTRTKATNYACIMPAFDTNDQPINPNNFASKLIGAMCEVTFTFKHYAISGQKKEGGQDVEAHDIFSAHVETVAMLKNPPAIIRSPYKGILTKRPHHRPQIPTRGEQVNAATAFLSQPNFGSVSTAPSPTAKSTYAPAAGSATSITTLISDDGKGDNESESNHQEPSLKRKLRDY